MKEEDIFSRVERFERTVATCLSIIPVLFAAQCFFAALGCPAFESMFKDFGAKLPTLTSFALSTWGFWLVFALIAPISGIVVAQKSTPKFSVIYSTVSGCIIFLVAQTLTMALFLPILQLGAVASGV